MFSSAPDFEKIYRRTLQALYNGKKWRAIMLQSSWVERVYLLSVYKKLCSDLELFQKLTSSNN